ncbi:MAG TPA: TRAP transporter small permease subunit [Gammaproteobacteria bacterium]
MPAGTGRFRFISTAAFSPVPLSDETADKLRGLSRALQRISEATGTAIAWLTLPMVAGTFVIVVLRYAFDVGYIWMQEGVVWLHAAVFMLAAAYTLRHDAHVRVDIFYRGMRPQRRALVDVLGIALFLLPMSVFILSSSWDYVAVSWQIREGSREAGGLPYPFMPLLKSTIPATSVLLVIEGVAELTQRVLVLLGKAEAPAPGGEPVEI